MSGLPWSKFFWSDYAADPALKICSFAAQGLWMRMLCIASEHAPAGYVAVNGNGLSPQGIARLVGGGVEEIEILIEELDHNGVFSRDRRGWIYSRRMINDAKKRRKASEAGKKGGNPKLRKDTENSDTFKGEDKGEVNPPPKPQRPEARDQSYSEDKSSGGEPPAKEYDPVKELFDVGVSVLTSTGSTEKQARSMIGKWRKDHDDSKVLAALIDCRTKAISEPVEWLQKRLKGGAGYVSEGGYEYRGDIESVIRESERRADWTVHWRAKADLEGR